MDGVGRLNIPSVEVVTLEKHSIEDDIAQFILDTKLLNPKKTYTDDVAKFAT